MKHVTREVAEAAVNVTSERLKRISDGPLQARDDPFRDVIHVLAIHLGKCGQEELSDQVHDFLIGYTNPITQGIAEVEVAL